MPSQGQNFRVCIPVHRLLIYHPKTVRRPLFVPTRSHDARSRFSPSPIPNTFSAAVTPKCHPGVWRALNRQQVQNVFARSYALPVMRGRGKLTLAT